MILSDRTIREQIDAGRIVIDPFDPALVQPSSVDMRLDYRFVTFARDTWGCIDLKQDLTSLTKTVEASDDKPFILHPGGFVLGSTVERVSIPDDLVSRVEGKSSLGRLGLMVHVTAGFLDPGFEGQVTLEILQRVRAADDLVPGDEDLSDQFHADDDTSGPAVRVVGSRLEVQRPERPATIPVLEKLLG